jgi:S1-C subfamily serine protease
MTARVVFNRVLGRTISLLLGIVATVFVLHDEIEAQARDLSKVQQALRENFPSEVLKRKVASPPMVSRGGLSAQTLYETTVQGVALITFRNKNAGAGVLISSTGEIITNEHVVRDAFVDQGDFFVSVAFIKEPPDQLNRDELLRAKVLRRNVVHDLAVIRIDGPLPPRARVISLAGVPPKVGDPVFAIGHPLDLLWSFERGMVSQVRPGHVWKYGDRVERKATVIQTSTPLSPGSSGGPLLNEQGNLVGVVAWGRQDVTGINFAISLQHIQEILKEIVK